MPGASQKVQASTLSLTYEGPSLVPWRLHSCWSGGHEFSHPCFSCLCRFLHHNLDLPCSYSFSSFSWIRCQSLACCLVYKDILTTCIIRCLPSYESKHFHFLNKVKVKDARTNIWHGALFQASSNVVTITLIKAAIVLTWLDREEQYCSSLPTLGW